MRGAAHPATTAPTDADADANDDADADDVAAARATLHSSRPLYRLLPLHPSSAEGV